MYRAFIYYVYLQSTRTLPLLLLGLAVVSDVVEQLPERRVLARIRSIVVAHPLVEVAAAASRLQLSLVLDVPVRWLRVIIASDLWSRSLLVPVMHQLLGNLLR